MMNILIQRLDDFVDRQIYFMSFSRKISVNEFVIARMQEFYEKCLKNRDILLMQSKFLLSFKLMRIERLISVDHDLDFKLLNIQD